MPFGLMTRVGHRYHYQMEDPIPQGKGAIYGQNVAANCKKIGYYGALSKNG